MHKYIYISIGLCYDFSLVDKLLAQPDVQIALGVKGITWQDCNRAVNKKRNIYQNKNIYIFLLLPLFIFYKMKLIILKVDFFSFLSSCFSNFLG
jgi:hypothetical protein